MHFPQREFRVTAAGLITDVSTRAREDVRGRTCASQRKGITHALKAPPPLAWPSSFVTMTAPTSTFSLKAFAWKPKTERREMFQPEDNTRYFEVLKYKLPTTLLIITIYHISSTVHTHAYTLRTHLTLGHLPYTHILHIILPLYDIYT